MKLSEYTLTVLKNFASINSGVVLQPGKIQKTMSPEKSILVEAELEDDIPCKFGIYDLNQFLGNITTLNDPDLTFSEKSVTMKDDLVSLCYFSCSPELIVTPPDKELSIKNPDVSFDLPHSTLSTLLKLASMNSLPNISLTGKKGSLSLQTHERKNDSSNYASTKLGKYDGDDFAASFKVENLKMIPDDYHIDMKLSGFSKFTSKTKKLTYFIALETT